MKPFDDGYKGLCETRIRIQVIVVGTDHEIPSLRACKGAKDRLNRLDRSRVVVLTVDEQCRAVP